MIKKLKIFNHFFIGECLELSKKIFEEILLMKKNFEGSLSPITMNNYMPLHNY